MGLASILKSRLIPAELENHINRIRKPIGSLGYDPWGYNNEVMKYGFSLTRQIYEKYFRVEATGVDKIPSEGPVLIVPNHSGQLPVDGLLIAYALASREKNPRIPRAMIERFFPTVPYLGNLLNEFGAVLGDPTNCAKMLANGEAVIVFPEGIRGSGKLYQDRYQLKRFGNGFMQWYAQDTLAAPPWDLGKRPKTLTELRTMLTNITKSAATTERIVRTYANRTSAAAWMQISSDVCSVCPTLWLADDISTSAHGGGPTPYLYLNDW